MYVCICNALTDQAVKAAIDGGALSAACVYRHHGCKPQCGKCACDMRAMIAEGSGPLAIEAAAAPER